MLVVRVCSLLFIVCVFDGCCLFVVCCVLLACCLQIVVCCLSFVLACHVLFADLLFVRVVVCWLSVVLWLVCLCCWCC